MADPGFPVGGRGPCSGGGTPEAVYVSKILYVKTKESGPMDSIIKVVLSAGMLVSGFVTVFLDNTLPGTVRVTVRVCVPCEMKLFVLIITQLNHQ